LKASINATSLHDPILVRKHHHLEGHYIIIDGQRRWTSCSDLGHKQIKCRVVDSDEQGYRTLALTQNIHREDLLPIEKANAIASLFERLKGEDNDVKQKILVDIVNLKKNTISELITTSKLDDYIKNDRSAKTP
jgi:ParB family chromosome partitioning protein